uniref:CARD domain-containing protein n=1 Tax=Denticeps clupeoides TaxID=299321 RepID=A0AAY4DI93_9TELE
KPGGPGRKIYNVNRSFLPGAEFVDQFRRKIIERVTAVEPIADAMYDASNVEKYADIMAAPTPQAKMRAIYKILNTEGSKTRFYAILLEREPELVEELSGSRRNW